MCKCAGCGDKLHEFLISILDKVGGMLYVPTTLPKRAAPLVPVAEGGWGPGQGWLIGGKKYVLSPPKIETLLLSPSSQPGLCTV